MDTSGLDPKIRELIQEEVARALALHRTARRVVRERDLWRIDGLDRMTRWRRRQAGVYPNPINPGQKPPLWDEAEVVAWTRGEWKAV